MSNTSRTGRTAGGARLQAVRWGALAGSAALVLLGGAAPAGAGPAHRGHDRDTATPIKHVVVIYDENVSFDHYFGTYPKAAGTDGTPFTAARHTPRANTLVSAHLLTKNPNQYAPQRLSPSQAVTCDQNHNYGPEQYAADGGKADQYVQNTETSKCSGNLFGEPGLVMDYYDGNTVTALWNYAQHYTLGDNSYSGTFGPSTPGALELVSGQTHGVVSVDPASGTEHDHAVSPVLNGSQDSTVGPNGKAVDSPACQAGPAAAGGYADRCGPGTRQPLLVISPYSKANAIDHTRTEQASITRFIEDNWHTGRIGDASFDQRAGTLDHAFDFRHPNDMRVLLNADGSVKSVTRISGRPGATPSAGSSTDGPSTAGNTPAARRERHDDIGLI